MRGFPCIICSSQPPVHAHHVKHSEKTGMGLKVSDCWTVPLCWECHHELHNAKVKEELFWSLKGVDPIEKAQELWRHTNQANAKKSIR